MTRLLIGVLMAAGAPATLLGQSVPPANQSPILETAATAPRAVSSSARETRLFELRIYHAADGKLDALHERFRTHTVRLLARHGIESVGFWVPRENKENLLVVLHAYPNQAARTASWQRFAIDPEWRKIKATSEADGKLVHQIDEMHLGPTAFCPVVAPLADASKRCFELRIFRGLSSAAAAEHYRTGTLKLLAEHGLTHVATWTPAGGKLASGVALISLVACDSVEAHTKASRALKADPSWISAHDERSQQPRENDEALILTATNYSPLR